VNQPAVWRFVVARGVQLHVVARCDAEVGRLLSSVFGRRRHDGNAIFSYVARWLIGHDWAWVRL
jgi:hypothetical protein